MSPLVAGCDVVFNLAARTSHVESLRDPLADLHANAGAQLALLELCRRENPGARIVYGSTRQLYGRPLYLPVDERHPVVPIDPNAVSKYAGEGYHMLYGQIHGMAVCALRLTNTYGPRMRVLDARQNFVGLWLRLAVAGEQLAVRRRHAASRPDLRRRCGTCIPARRRPRRVRWQDLQCRRRRRDAAGSRAAPL